MTLETIGWTFFSALSIVSALFVVTRKNPLYSALWLMGFFFSLSGMYAFLKASFLATIQIFIYVGAVIVLYLFVIMMVNFDKLKQEDRSPLVSPLWAGLISLGFFGLITLPIHFGLAKLPAASQVPASFGSTPWMAQELYKNYPFPIELASVLLIIALVGAFGLTGRFMRKKKVVTSSRPKEEKEELKVGAS